jgi:molybdenum cofactor biosynthesis protein B
MPHAHTLPHRPLGFHVLTVSTSRTETEDRSGPLIRELVEAASHVVAGHGIVPDDPARIGDALDAALADPAVHVVVLNGGTGVSARDCTPEVVAARLERVLPGFGELFRMLSWEEIGSAAMLSTAIGGIAHGRPVFAVPGSPKACRLAMERLILPDIGHLVGELRKETPLPAPGWRGGLATLGAELKPGGTAPVGLPRAVLDVLESAGAHATLPATGGDWFVCGFPDLVRPGAKVLAVRGEPGAWEVLALHRFPTRVGVVGTTGYLPATVEGLPPHDGPLFAVDGAGACLLEDDGVTRWDGRRRTPMGSPDQALASLVLEWSQR